MAKQASERGLVARLFEPIDIASLVYYRIAFASIALWETWRFASHGWIERYLMRPSYHFTFYGFDWVQPWPGEGMYWHFGALAVLAFCMIVGFCYRAAAALFFVGFTQVFLIEKASYLNHLYLFCWIAFAMILVPAHRDASVDAYLRPKLRSETAPAWTLWLLRLMMGICYSYAGLAKINWDWLNGWPLRLWLPPESSFPIIGQFFDELWFQLFFSYGGLLLDLLVPFALLWKRTRWPAFLVVVFFHLSNSRLFGIGIFPWLSLATTLLFFAPDWPRRIFNYPRRGPAPAGGVAQPLGRAQWMTAAALAVLAAVHLLVPLRHFLYPGNVSWTEEGHNFAWHQKLRDKRCDTDFMATDKATGEEFEIRERDFLSSRQKRKMSARPHMMLEFAHYLKREYLEREGREIEVRVEANCSLNGRPPQLLIDPEVDLAAQPRNLWPKPWILPLTQLRPDEID